MYGWGYNYKNRLGFSSDDPTVCQLTQSTQFVDEHVVNVHCGRWQSVALTGNLLLLESYCCSKWKDCFVWISS
jgi:hypothetical protein